MDRIVDLVEQIVADTDGTHPSAPKYVEIKGNARVERQGSRPYFGSIPDFGSEDERLRHPGRRSRQPGRPGPASKAGDHIVEIGDRKITGLDDFDLALRRFKAGEEIPVVVLRGGKKVALKVVLGKPK